MDRKEAILRIKEHMKHHGIGKYPHLKLKEALDMAIAALSQPNEPLTWEELMEMEGQPVYIVEIGVRGYWVFVTNAGRFDAHFLTADGDNDYGNEGLYGRTWIAYRFPPEGEA